MPTEIVGLKNRVEKEGEKEVRESGHHLHPALMALA